MDHDQRKVPVVKLIVMGPILEHFESFSANVARCNFSVKVGWRGKTYIDKHDVDEYQPDDLRGIVAVALYYVRTEDYVILTVEQYRDYDLVLNTCNLDVLDGAKNNGLFP